MLATTESASDTPINRSNKRTIQTLLWALKPLKRFPHYGLPLLHAKTFLAVALEGGNGVREYARSTDLHPHRVSKCLHEIAAQGLVTICKNADDPQPKKLKVTLTDKGRALLLQILRSLNRRDPWSLRKLKKKDAIL